MSDPSISTDYGYDLPVLGDDCLEDSREAAKIYSRILSEVKVISSVSNDINFLNGPNPDIFDSSGSSQIDYMSILWRHKHFLSGLRMMTH